MSGIAGVFYREGYQDGYRYGHGDGPLVSTALLQRFSEFLSYRGPDAQEVWSQGSVGFIHTQFRTTREARAERQPASLEGRYWITADARLDCREELVDGLAASGRRVSLPAPDSELLLHAYAAWGASCVERLRGDFAFALWDENERRLFCACDHFGIKPFYYVELCELFLFSNTLDCLRLHAEVSSELNEAAVGDFLLFGLNHNPATTIFRDIQRLPPAHTLTVTASQVQIKRYWTMPVDGRIRYRREEEYVEHYRDLLKKAVRDRMRTERVSILLSGGLDSGSLAAMAKELVTQGEPTQLSSATFVYESLIPDDEGKFAHETAEFLQIPNRQLAMDYLRPFERWDEPAMRTPEPVDDPLIAGLFDQFRFVAQGGRVAWDGEGGDNLMWFQMWPYVHDLRRRGEWARLLREVAHYAWVRPFPWRGILQKMKRVVGRDETVPAFPEWIAPDFARRLNLRERWREGWESPFAELRHPIHGKGYDSMYLSLWTEMFEVHNPGLTRSAVEVRYPFLDLRVAEYLLALPPFPWFFQKRLTRQAMANRLPESVLRRRKTPLQKDPLQASLLREDRAATQGIPWSLEMARFIALDSIGPVHARVKTGQSCVTARPHCLNVWLLSARKFGYKS